jgi:protein-disulfide isomerase
MFSVKKILILAACLGALAAVFLLSSPSVLVPPVDASPIKSDPTAPVGGNPAGDVTIVVFSDYNCPFCKSADSALEKLAKTDGHIRLVYKDWPILTDASTYGARMALAAKYQDKYVAVHSALMGILGMRISQAQMLTAIKASGVDMGRLESDLKTHRQEIEAQLQHNGAQAESLGLQGTPAYLIGPYLVPSALDYHGFKQVVAKARAKAKGK